MSVKPKTRPHLEPDIPQMKAYKLFFHGSDSPASFCLLPEANNSQVAPKVVQATFAKAREILTTANSEGAGIFMAINVVSGNQLLDKAVTKINAVFIDVDGTMELPAIEKLKPHLIVESSRGKFHAYWRVSDLAVADFKPVQRALAQKFGTDPAVCNPARIMRMPGSVHHKGKPVLAKIVHIEKSAEPLPTGKLLKQLGVVLEDDASQKLEAETESRVTSTSEIAEALAAIPVANDRPTWLKVGMAIHSAMPDEHGLDLWTTWSKSSPKYDADDQRKNWHSFSVVNGGVGVASLFWLARRNGWKPQTVTTLPADDFALIDEFTIRVKHLLKFDADLGRWLVFLSPVWRDDEARVVQAARRFIEPMLKQAKGEGATAALLPLKKHASMTGLRALLREASAVPELNVRTQDFDVQPHLLAVANGVADLRTGELRAGLPEDMLKAVAPTALDPAADCPKFRQFISFFTCDRPNYAAFLQRALGYTLFGHTNEQVLFIALGGGGNGKGTLFRMMAHVLGKALVKPVPANLLTRAYAGNANGPTEAIMALNGPRMIQCGEGEGNKRFDSTFIKQLSGSDAFSGRSNHGHQTEFTPVCKLWLAVNAMPEVPHSDDAMWRRLIVLPCDARIEKRDGAYEDELKAEAPGILNWLIEGAKQYHSQKLGESKVVTKAKERARKQFDSVESWLSERCEAVKDATLAAGPAADDYRAFCRRQGRQPVSPQEFPKAVVAKGYQHKVTNQGKVFVGLRMKAG